MTPFRVFASYTDTEGRAVERTVERTAPTPKAAEAAARAALQPFAREGTIYIRKIKRMKGAAA